MENAEEKNMTHEFQIQAENEYLKIIQKIK